MEDPDQQITKPFIQIPNLPKQIIQLICQYLTENEIFLCFRFLKRQYHNQINSIEKVLLEDKYQDKQINQLILDSFEDFQKLKEIIYDQKNYDIIPFSTIYSDGGAFSDQFYYWFYNIFRINNRMICSKKKDDILVVGGLIDIDQDFYSKNYSQIIDWWQEGYKPYTEALIMPQIEDMQEKSNYKFVASMVKNGFQFQQGIELHLPHKILESQQCIIKELLINCKSNYTSPLKTFAAFISNDIIDFKNDAMITNIGQVKNQFQLLEFIKKFQLEVEYTNIDFEVQENLNESIDKQNKIQQLNEQMEEQIEIENQQTSQENSQNNIQNSFLEELENIVINKQTHEEQVVQDLKKQNNVKQQYELEIKQYSDVEQEEQDSQKENQSSENSYISEQQEENKLQLEEKEQTPSDCQSDKQDSSQQLQLEEQEQTQSDCQSDISDSCQQQMYPDNQKDLDNFQFCYFKIRKQDKIHPLVWFSNLNSSYFTYQLKIPINCQIACQFLEFKLIDASLANCNIDLTYIVPKGIIISAPN